MSDNLPVLFQIQPPPAVVPIQKSAKELAKDKALAHRRRLQERLADVKVYEKLGGKVLKISAKIARTLGDEINSLGIKAIGHGRIFLSGDHAVTSVDECDAIIAQLRAQDPPADPDKIIGILQIKLGFSKLLLETGEAHLRATTQADNAQNGKAISIPFPPNHNLGIAFTPAKPPVET